MCRDVMGRVGYVPGSNNMRLYTYIKGMKCDGSGVSLLKNDGLNYTDPADQVEILNQQFVSSFTREDCTSFPQIGPGLQKTALPITIQENGVKKLLEGLNPHKAGGPDQISPQFLK